MIDILLDKLNKNQTYDISLRELTINNKKVTFVYLNFLVDNRKIADVIYSLDTFNSRDLNAEEIKANLIINSLEIIKNVDDVVNEILKGLLAICIDGETDYVIVDTRKYPGREVAEPDSEKVVRGSRDGFTENIGINIALVRRRIASPNLIIKKFIIGSVSRTDVALIYLENCVNKQALSEVISRLNKISIKELTMSDKALEELIVSRNLSPFPLVKYTERPDTFARQLYQGMFGIIVDTSPSAMLGPVSVFDHLQHAEEFRQTIITGTYLRIIRLLGVIFGFIMLPLWFALSQLGFSGSSWMGTLFDVNLSKGALLLQILIIEIAIELVRMASIHTPSALATSMGLIAGVIIGDMAIEVGLFSIQVALLGSLSALASYITPSYELSLANKVSKIFLFILIYFFNIYGFFIGIILLFIYLATLKSFNYSYLSPLFPFNGKRMLKQLIRTPFKNNK